MIEALCARSYEETTEKLKEIEAQILRKRTDLRQFETEYRKVFSSLLYFLYLLLHAHSHDFILILVGPCTISRSNQQIQPGKAICMSFSFLGFSSSFGIWDSSIATCFSQHDLFLCY